jgi:hypothetical protein
MLLRELINESMPGENAWKTSSVKAALNKGYSEIEDFMNGKMTAREFANFISGMNNSIPENSREERVKSNLIMACKHIVRYLKKTNTHSEADVAAIEKAIDELEF